jgi:hypothetical protein
MLLNSTFPWFISLDIRYALMGTDFEFMLLNSSFDVPVCLILLCLLIFYSFLVADMIHEGRIFPPPPPPPHIQRLVNRFFFLADWVNFRLLPMFLRDYAA